MNYELQKEIEEWRKRKNRINGMIITRKKMYPDLNETLEDLVSSHGLPNVPEYNKCSAQLIPKLIAEVDFLNMVIGGLRDETTAAETVEKLMRAMVSIKELRGGSGGNPLAGYVTLKKIFAIVEESLK